MFVEINKNEWNENAKNNESKLDKMITVIEWGKT